MNVHNRELLRRLGAGESIASLCNYAGWTRPQFDVWWAEECRRRVPNAEGYLDAPGIRKAVTIRRDEWGVPYIEAESDTDLFFGFGFATAQDRLFQLEYQRRKSLGRLAEILGPEAVESDVLYRTVGLAQIAKTELESLPAAARLFLEAYTAGINAYLKAAEDCLPIEFDLLDYRPEPWSPIDSLAIAGEFRWYLTGRFPVIAVPEFVKRAVGDGPLYQAFLQGEADDECIVPPGSYRPRGMAGVQSGGGDDNGGSNNWVLSGGLSMTGKPIVANDPHVPFGVVSIWHEVVLNGGSFQVAGAAYAGVPALMIGRTPRVAWGITNNICSLRDLYMEKTDPQYPGQFLFDGKWEPAKYREEVIQVRGTSPVVKTIVSSRNGPIVDEVLPGPARGKGPVSLRWVGSQVCGWLPAMLDMNRARNVDEFRQATKPWAVPTFNLVYADDAGYIGHQCVGRLPLRAIAERGYRPGWEPQHQWQGVIDFEDMPHQSDPARGYIVTANNRLAPDDYPQPLSGTWSSGHRARQIRLRLEAQQRWTPEECRDLQLDVLSGRALFCVPPLVELLDGDSDPRMVEVVKRLRNWTCLLNTDSVSASIFNVFFVHWSKAVVAERLPADQIEFVAPLAGGLACALLVEDAAGWFHKSDRKATVRAAMQATLDELTRRLGPELKSWKWERLHFLLQKHFLSGRGDLGQLLDRNGCPARGDMTTICSTTPDGNFAAHMGASYRMVADMSDAKQGMWAISIAGASGNPGSANYGDQIEPWSKGEFHYLSLKEMPSGPTFTLEPG